MRTWPAVPALVLTLMFPLRLIFPFTSNFSVGAFVPIPTFWE
jgi:hypothetical protein